MRKITFYLTLTCLFLGVAAFAQGTVTGTVMGQDFGGPLGGANVMEVGTSNGAISDFDGNFTLNVTGSTGTVQVSYLGYVTRTLEFTLSGGTAELGSIMLAADENVLGEVVVIGSGVIDLAEGRETPVAVSTIRKSEIQAKVVGNVELAEALKSTPSAFISGQTGFGDSQLYLRGFDQTNIAVLLNGQPVNGMEDGRVYWSNWAGIADIANAVQVQRGLGSSKLAISSVGGTTNIVMKAADRNQGGFVRFMGGNDSYFKGTASYDTGLSESGWAFSVLVDYWQAHRKWARGTYGEGQNYFFAVGYKPNDNHSFNFLLTGAPQLHGQRWSQSLDIIEADPKFNQHWGFYEGEITSERQNYYHKPVMNLNWDWNINETSDLSTVLYASWGRGGGTGPRGNGRIRTEDPDGNGPLYGQIDFDAIQVANTAIGVGGDYDNPAGAGYIRRSSVNNHQWYGLISNYNNELSDRFSLNVGVDFRMYTGDHFRQVTNLYGLTGWSNDRPDGAVVTNTYEATPWAALFNFADEGDRIDYDYSEDINYQGVFGQLEYSDGKFSTFFQGALSNQSYQREGRFDDPGTSEKLNKVGYNLKGGVAYKLNENNTMFLNAGHYSRQPFLDNTFVNIRSSNELIQPEVDNEEITSFEAGYVYSNNDIRVNFNAYVTDWDNRTILSSDIDDNGTPDDDSDDINLNVFQRGVRQYHSGAELDFNYRATNWLTLTGYVSAGSWIFKGMSSFAVYNDDTQELVAENDGVNRNGVKVSTAPQFTSGFGFRANVIDGLSLDGNINYGANHYLFTDTRTSRSDFTGQQLKPYSLTDLGVTYRFDIAGSNDITLRANVFNVFDEIRIQQTDAFGFFNTNGRTFNASVRYNF